MSAAKVPKHYNRLPGTSMGYKFGCSIITTNENPGPGTYQLPTLNLRTPIGTKFGESPRFDKPPRTFHSPKSEASFKPMLNDRAHTEYSDGISNKHARQMLKSNSSTFGIAGRPDFFPKDQFPHVGPGLYQPKDKAYLGGIAKRNQSQIFNTRKFTYFHTDPDIPGPGSYSVDTTIKSIKNSTRSIFSKSKKEYLDIDRLAKNSPSGESYYSTAMPPLSKSVRGVTFSKGKKSSFLTKDNLPGPGSYHSVTQTSSPKTPLNIGTFGVSKKFSSKRYFGGDPGPGDYDPQNSISFHSTRRGVSFTKSLTAHFKNAFSSLPGPGNYELPDEFTLKKQEAQKRIQLVKERIEERKRAEALKALKPIMDETEKKLTRNDSKSSSKIYVTKEDLDSPAKFYRDSIFEEFVGQSSSPGPKYLVQGEISKELGKRGTTFFLGKEKEKGYIDELVKKKIPGPGAYQFENNVETKLPVTFAASKRDEDIFVSKYKKTVPGVGLYDQKFEKKAVGGSIGKAVKPTTFTKPEKKKFMRLESKLTGLDLTMDNIELTWDP